MSEAVPGHNCCRTCLKVDTLNPIFRDKHQAERYSEVLADITGLQIVIDDGLPQMMCKNCIDFINKAIEFRRKSHLVENILIKRITPAAFIQTENIDIQNIEIEKRQPGKKSRKNYVPPIPNKIQKMFIFRNKTKVKNEEGTQDEKKLKRLKRDVEMECKICGKILTSRFSLSNHIKTHTGHTTVCEHCGKKFTNNVVLLRHCRAKHGYEKVDKCSYCDYRGCDLRSVQIHERLHTGERPYACDQCPANFHRKETYRQHMDTHATENVVQCDICAAEFRSRNRLNNHKHKVHTNKQFSYVCYVCQNIFAKKDNVVKHMKGKHAILKPDRKRIERILKQELHFASQMSRNIDVSVMRI